MDRRAKLGLSALTVFAALVLLAVTTRTYPPKAGTIMPTGSPLAPRFSHTATLLSNNKVLIAGGMERNGTWLDSAELYDSETGQFTEVGKMLSRRAGATATLLANGKVLIAGGNDGIRTLASAEMYDPVRNAFSVAASMGSARAHAVAITLKNGKGLILGGNGDGDTEQLSSAELFDPDSARFVPTGRMLYPRASFAAVRLQDGKVLVMGGASAGAYPNHRVETSAEVYDPDTGRFTVTGNMRVPRHKLGAALLPDGRVLVVGGSDTRDWRGMYSSTEIYTPASGRFSPGPEMKFKRFKLPEGVLQLEDGRVLIAGGSAQPEIYDPASSTLVTSSGETLDGFFFSSATLLRNGEVLLVGGYGMDPRAGAVRHAWRWQP
jgi:Kelch motif